MQDISIWLIPEKKQEEKQIKVITKEGGTVAKEKDLLEWRVVSEFSLSH